MDTEFRFEATDGDDRSYDDLRTLHNHLAGDSELRQHAHVGVLRKSALPGELGIVEFVLSVVSTAAGVGQLALGRRPGGANRSGQLRLRAHRSGPL